MKRGGLVFIAGGLPRSIAKSVNILGGFEFSRLDDARSGSALTAVQGCHSLPSCRFATSKAVIHYRARPNPLCQKEKSTFGALFFLACPGGFEPPTVRIGI